MSGVLEGNMYPTDGAMYAQIPEDQVKEERDKTIGVISFAPLLKEICEHLAERVSFYQSVRSIPDDVLTNPEEFMHVVAANKLTAENLEKEKEKIEILMSEYSKK